MSYSKAIKQNANKEGFKSLLWVILGIMAVMFSVQIMKALKGLFGFLSGKTSEQELNDKNEVEKNKAETLITQSGYTQNSLPKPISYYSSIADSLFNYMQGWGTNAEKMIEILKPLSSMELKAVYLKFGSRINLDFGNDAGNLFTWFDWELSDYSPFSIGALTRMRLIWKKTNLPITF
jgi:hypothetical protein